MKRFKIRDNAPKRTAEVGLESSAKEQTDIERHRRE